MTSDKSAAELLTRRGRPRSAQSHQAILEATLALFAEVGLQGLSIEAIAERAGVGKTTIYRRWSSKEDLIKDALELFRANNPLPHTGHMRSDLLYLTREARELFALHPLMSNLMLKFIAEMRTQPEIYHAFREKLVAPRIEQFRQIIIEAQARGEVRPELDVNLALSLIFSALIYNNIFNELLDPQLQRASTSEELVDALLRGIGPYEGL